MVGKERGWMQDEAYVRKSYQDAVYDTAVCITGAKNIQRMLSLPTNIVQRFLAGFWNFRAHNSWTISTGKSTGWN